MRELLNETMTRAAHECDMARAERSNKRLWITILILIMLFVGTNGWWIYRESQFTDEVTTTTTIDSTQETEGGGDNVLVGGDYGTTESKDNKDNN